MRRPAYASHAGADLFQSLRNYWSHVSLVGTGVPQSLPSATLQTLATVYQTKQL